MAHFCLIYYSSRQVAKSWKACHFLDELPRSGIPVFVFNENHLDINSFPDKIKYLREKHHNLIALISADDKAYNSQILEIFSAHKIPAVLFCPDNLHVPYRHRKTARFYDLVWLTSSQTEPLFKRWGANTIFLPYAANPYVFQPQFGQPELPGICFIGKPYGARWDKICKLTAAEISVSLYTNVDLKTVTANPPHRNLKKKGLRGAANMLKTKEGRMCLEGAVKKSLFYRTPSMNRQFLQRENSVTFESMIDLYSRYMLVLGTCDVWSTFTLKYPLLKTHLRGFEVPMCGGVHLINRSPEMLEFFDEDSEIICYDSDEEMIDKAKFYLNPERANLRQKIRTKARERSLAEHTWTHRFRKLFGALGIG